MSESSFSQLLPLYTWFLLAGFIGFMSLIGRFYQRFSGERTFYWLFGVPVLLLGIETIRQTRLQVGDDDLGLALSAVAGVVLILMSMFLYHRMTSGRDHKQH